MNHSNNDDDNNNNNEDDENNSENSSDHVILQVSSESRRANPIVVVDLVELEGAWDEFLNSSSNLLRLEKINLTAAAFHEYLFVRWNTFCIDRRRPSSTSSDTTADITRLETLTIDGCSFAGTDEEMIATVNALSEFLLLVGIECKKLTLAWLSISQDSFALLLQKLVQIQSLESLELERMPLVGRSIGLSFQELLGRDDNNVSTAAGCEIKELSLGFCAHDDDFIRLMCTGLRNNSCLQTLNFLHLRMRDVELHMVAQALLESPCNNTLTNIVFVGNNLSEHAWTSFTLILNGCNALQELNISDSSGLLKNVNDEYQSFATALERNSALKRLTIHEINDKLARPLLCALEGNRTLELLNLSRSKGDLTLSLTASLPKLKCLQCFAGRVNMEWPPLLHALWQNMSLVELAGSSIRTPHETMLTRILMRNKVLSKLLPRVLDDDDKKRKASARTPRFWALCVASLFQKAGGDATPVYVFLLATCQECVAWKHDMDRKRSASTHEERYLR